MGMGFRVRRDSDSTYAHYYKLKYNFLKWLPEPQTKSFYAVLSKSKSIRTPSLSSFSRSLSCRRFSFSSLLLAVARLS